MVKDGTIVATGLVTQRAGDPTLAGSGRSGDKEVVLAVDPVSIDQLGKKRAINAARGTQIDIFDDGGLS